MNKYHTSYQLVEDTKHLQIKLLYLTIDSWNMELLYNILKYLPFYNSKA
jgi:hypothetical protein